MKVRLLATLLILLIGCSGIRVENTRDMIAFEGENFNIYLANATNGTTLKLISSRGDIGYHSPFWLNEIHLGFVFFFWEVTTKTEYPLGVYDVSKGKVALYNPDHLILGIKNATRFSDTSVLIVDPPYYVTILQLNSLDTTNFVDLHSFQLKRGPKHLRISPNKNSIVFAGLDSTKFKHLPRYPSGYTISGSDSLDDIYVYNILEKTLIQLTNSNCSDIHPSWSPDGNHIVFSSNRTANFEIYVMNKDGTNTKQLTDNTVGDKYPVYSSKGDRIAFVSIRSGQSQIWIMNSDGSDIKQLTNLKGGVFGPLSWSLTR